MEQLASTHPTELFISAVVFALLLDEFFTVILRSLLRVEE